MIIRHAKARLRYFWRKMSDVGNLLNDSKVVFVEYMEFFWEFSEDAWQLFSQELETKFFQHNFIKFSSEISFPTK
jgi:hypothetical protein